VNCIKGVQVSNGSRQNRISRKKKKKKTNKETRGESNKTRPCSESGPERENSGASVSRGGGVVLNRGIWRINVVDGGEPRSG